MSERAYAVAPPERYAGTAVQKASVIAGIVFLLVGILGFVPGATTNYDQLRFAGHMSEALLLGIFQVSVLHNLVHLLFGVLGLALARTVPAARSYLIAGGLVYLVLWVYGLVVADTEMGGNFVPLNSADNTLHLVLALGMVLLGVILPPRRVPPKRSTGVPTA